MAVAIKLPRMSDTMEEGTIVSWLVKVGDTVKGGDMLADVETDKATMELENFEKGEVLFLNAAEGDTIPVETVIAIIGKKGEDYSALLSSAPAESIAPSEAKVEETAPIKKEEPGAKQVSTPTPAIPATSNDRVFVSPLAKKMAEEKGIDLRSVSGSGDNGRIVKRDIENYVPSTSEALPAVATYTGEESYQDIPVTQMRKTIARRLGESKFTAPHFYLSMDIVMDKAMEARKKIKTFTDAKVSMNDFVIKAAAIALRQHPMVNASWLEDKIRINNHIHVGVAVAVDDGLLVPVVKFADNKSLSQIGAEVRVAATKAKNKELQPADWEGNTFTISNLGMFGINEFTAIINPPDACILAVGAAKEAVIVEDGVMRAGHKMTVTLSCDHRVVDGVTGSKFLNTLRELLEEPVRLLV